MKLSIIVPVYKDYKNLQNLLDHLIDQTNNNFEVIFVIDTQASKCLDVIDQAKKSIKGKIKIVFNSKRMGRDSAINVASEFVTGDYVMIFSITDSFNEDMVRDLINFAKKYKTDVIEFNARFRKPFRFDGEQRDTVQIKGDVDENRKQIFAYTYPFEFNKIFKKELFKEVINLKLEFASSLNSRFSVKLILQLIRLSNSYVFLPENIIRYKRSPKKLFNPLRIVKEWKEMMDNAQFVEYKSSLEYNCYFASKVFYISIVYHHKNKVLQQKFEKYLKENFGDDFYHSNEFYLAQNKETDVLKASLFNNNTKLYKDL